MSAWMRWRPLVVALVLSYATAGIGGAFTDLGPWYFALQQPDWKPPDWAFGPIWTLIFTLAAVSAAMAWQASEYPHERRRVVLLFGLNAVLNVAWSALFFTLKRPDWALLEWAGLWCSVVSLVVGLWPLSRVAALLNLPYVVWVTTAGVLNQANVALNGPFN
jgi:translocator protein